MSTLTEPLKVVYEVVEINATRFEIKEIVEGQLIHVVDTKKEADCWCRNLNMAYNDGRNDGYFRAEKDMVSCAEEKLANYIKNSKGSLYDYVNFVPVEEVVFKKTKGTIHISNIVEHPDGSVTANLQGDNPETEEHLRIERLKLLVQNSTHVWSPTYKDLAKISEKGHTTFSTINSNGVPTYYLYSGDDIKQLKFFKMVE